MTTDTIHHIDPTTLTLAANVRADARLDATFLDSIRERGVLEVITATRLPDESLQVLRGQRRTLAAQRVGLPTVPVRVVDDVDEAGRIVDQLTENVHRADMRRGEVRDAVAQLALIGVPAHQIAQRVAISKADVAAAVGVAGDERAKAAMDGHDLTLEDAALWVEFAGDDVALAALDRAAEKGHPLAHAAERLRRSAPHRAAVAARVAELVDDGLPGVARDTVVRWGSEIVGMVDQQGVTVTEETAPLMPGARLAVFSRNEWASSEKPRLDECWIVDDPAEAGLMSSWEWRSAHGDGREAAAAAEKEAEAAARAEAKRAADERTAAWEAVTTVRRAWIRDNIANATRLPKGGEAMLLELLGNLPHAPLLDEWGVDLEAECDRIAAGGGWRAQRVLVLALTAALSGWEATMSNPSVWVPLHADRTLRDLQSWGYDLSELEAELVDRAQS